MGKTAKIFLGLAAGLILIAGIALWLLASNMDGLVKRAIEDTGSATLGTRVSLSGVTITIADASAALRGLSIANPAGFSEPFAFKLDAIDVSIDPQSITTKEIVIPRVTIDNALLTFEQVGSKNNLQTLLDALNADNGDSGATAGEEVLLVIRELRLRGTGMKIVADQLGEPLNITLPDLVLRDIGKQGAGVTAEEAARQIAGPVLARAKDAARDRVKDELKVRAREELDKQKDKALDSVRKKLFGK